MYLAFDTWDLVVVAGIAAAAVVGLLVLQHERHKDVPDDVRERVQRWARAQLEGRAFPLERFYPDVA